MIIPVILCGGVGNRLWPLSNPSHPKQFHKLTGDKSLFQNTIARVVNKDFLQQPVIITGFEHRFIVAEQLREMGLCGLKIIVEPEPKNTLPSVILTMLEISKTFPESQILVLPSDHYIYDDELFLLDVKIAAEEINHIKLFGITPSYPETEYGYIMKGPKYGELNYVKKFTEKPNLELAKIFLKSEDYYWNSGMFLIPIETLRKEIAKYQPNILENCEVIIKKALYESDFIFLPKEEFASLEEISIDHGLIEKLDKAIFYKANFRWSDLGSWRSLWNLQEKDENGNSISSNLSTIESFNNYVNLDEQEKIILAGVSDLAIVKVDDKILISDMNKAHLIKKIKFKLD